MHEAHVVDAPLEHRDAVEARPEGESLIFFRVESAILQDLRVHHAGTSELYPPVAQFFGDVLADGANVYFDGRFGEREETRPETYLGGASENFAEEFRKRSFEVRERDIFADSQTFYL